MGAVSRLVKFDKQSIDRAAMALAKMFGCEDRLLNEEDMLEYSKGKGIWVVGDVIADGDILSEQDEFWCSFNFTDMVRKVIRALEEDSEQEIAKARDEDASNAEAEAGNEDCSISADSASADDCDTVVRGDIRDSAGDMVDRAVEDAQRSSRIDIEAERLFDLVQFAKDCPEEYKWLLNAHLLAEDTLSVKTKASSIYVKHDDKLWAVQSICKNGKSTVVSLIDTSAKKSVSFYVPLELIDADSIIAFNRHTVIDVTSALALDNPTWEMSFKDDEGCVSVNGFGALYKCKSLDEACCRLVDLYTSSKTSKFADKTAVSMMMEERMSRTEIDIMLAAVSRHGMKYLMEDGLETMGYCGR